MTPEDVAAEAIRRWVDGDVLQDAIAAAIREAVVAAVERCAKVAEVAAAHHRDHCGPGCRCADGWHIAAKIREGT